MAQLLVVAPDGQERAIDLSDRPVTIGRSEECDVVLSEQKASRRHCTFRPWRGGWRVLDDRSSNGTWLGGKCVLSARLQPGDEVEIGDTVITFVASPSELPKADLVRARMRRRVPVPWSALVAAGVLGVAAWFGAGAAASEERDREAAAWKGYAQAEIARAEIGADADTHRKRLAALELDLTDRPAARDAVAIVRGAAARGLPQQATDARVPAWRQSLDRLDATRARMPATERRTQLRELLSRHLTDPAAAAALAQALRGEEASAAERSAATAAQSLDDADRAIAASEWGRALDAFSTWSASVPAASRDDERAVAARMAEVRQRAREDAASALAAYEQQVSEGRVASASSSVDAAVHRLRGTGWDAWLAARTRRAPSRAGGAPDPRGPSVRADDAALALERMKRLLQTADELTRRRRFADAGVLLRDAAGGLQDPPLRAEVESRAAELAAEAELLELVLSQIRQDARPFGPVPVGKGTGRVTGTTDAGLLIADARGAAPAAVALADVESATLVAVVGKAQLEPQHWIAAALLAHDLGDASAYAAWMRKALADASLQRQASAVHARILGVAVPDGGYVPHPKDAASILTADEERAFRNAEKIAALTADLAKTLDKIDASKQAKSVANVAEAYARLEAARKHALELIFDEKKYFYPYRDRMREYVPVQKEVDVRVAAVREAWEDGTSAKVRSDAALDKLLQHAKEVVAEVQFLGGDATAASERVARLERYLGRELTVRTYFVTPEQLALHEYNDAMLAQNAKLAGDILDSERAQVRITNEYRVMFGHRRVLRLHEKLVAAARGHSKDMSDLGFFDHMSPIEGKRTPWDRMTLAGYTNQPCSENIHAGGGDPQTAHDGWARSSGHHRNLLMPGWSELGTGQSGRYWTQNFGYAQGDDAIGGPGPQ